MATKIKSAILTLEDVAHYRKQIELLESLVRQRDEISDRIEKIDEVLYSALKDLDLSDWIPNIKSAKQKQKEPSRHRSSESVADRLLAACKGGATKLQVVKALGVSPKTVDAYLYSSKIGGKILDRTYNDDGVAIWTPKA